MYVCEVHVCMLFFFHIGLSRIIYAHIIVHSLISGLSSQGPTRVTAKNFGTFIYR